MRRTSKGFLLIDSLISVFICSVVCLLCYAIYEASINYEEGYRSYQEASNERLVEVFAGLNECETCEVIDESD